MYSKTLLTKLTFFNRSRYNLSMYTINDLIVAEIAFKPPVTSVRNDNRYRPDSSSGIKSGSWKFVQIL